MWYAIAFGTGVVTGALFVFFGMGILLTKAFQR